MSTSLLYHAFGFKTYKYISTKYRNGIIYFHVKKKDDARYCTKCKSRDFVLFGPVERRWNHVPIGLKPIIIVGHLHILKCKKCGATCLENLDIAEARKSYTNVLVNYVLSLAKDMTLKAISDKLTIGWDTVKTIVKEDMKSRLKHRKFNKIRIIAIDEVAVRKGHRYLTNVVDLETGVVVYSTEGRDSDCLKDFFKKIKRCKKPMLEAVALDMSPAYLKAVRLYAPKGIKIIHDRYHMVAKMNDVIDKVRRSEYQNKTDQEKAVIKGSRYLLLSASEKIAKDEDKHSRLQALLALNETIHKSYLLKEDLRLFWKQGSRETARLFIETWLNNARSVGNKYLNEFSDTIEKHSEGILNYYDHPITTGPLEGINNKIKVLKRIAYGYRDMEFFKLRILFIRNTKFMLTGA